jgi:hypothetical protein
VTTQIQLRRDTSANWSSANPVLAEGEIGMDMTVNAFKVGDGVSAWDDIDYAGTDISLDDYYTKVEADDAFQPKGDYLTDFVEEDPTVPDHVKGITQDDIDGWNAGGSGGSGSSVHIGDTPPENPEEGQLWQSSASGDEGLYCWDGSVWFEVAGANGADGADGNIQDGAADGSQDGIIATWDSADDQWQPNDAVTVDATGNVGIGEGSPDKALVVRGASQQIARFSTPSAVRGYITFSDGNTTDENSQGIGVVGNDVKIWAGNSEAVTIAANGEATFSPGDQGAFAKIRTLESPLAPEFVLHRNGAETIANKAISVTATDGDKFVLDYSGNATFSGTVNATKIQVVPDQVSAGATYESARFNASDGDTTAQLRIRNQTSDGAIDLHCYAGGATSQGSLKISARNGNYDDVDFVTFAKVTGNAVFSGTINSTRVIQDGAPVIDAKGLINTLSTLRNATKDETTLEGLRDAIGNAIGGLIEEFENQIATMPAPEPEVSTMEEAE